MADGPFLRAKNWARFQHYRGRRPPWIKLHRELLDNFEFSRLPVASKALAPCLWLLASEYDDGAIPADANAIAFRLHMTSREFLDALSPLLDYGFFSVDDDASKALAECKQHAMPESESESERETEKESDGDFFDDWYGAYPKKVGKGQARKAYRLACKKAKADVLLAAAKRFAVACAGRDPTFIPHPATWLNGERWLDEAPPSKPTQAQAPAEPWEKRMQGFKETGFWVGTWGPRPGEPHCYVPRELIEKYLQ